MASVKKLDKESLQRSTVLKKAVPDTFNISAAKSTVTNPSTVFKWISVDDEKRLWT